MNNATKMTALVAVLGLCLAALAGSAYAYNATYVDTIDAQPIENVYVAINDNATGTDYGNTEKLDLDVEYNSLNAKVGEAYKMYYNVASAKVNNTAADNEGVSADEGFTAKVVGQTAIFCGIIDSVKLQAYGDDATGTLTISGLMDANEIDGVESITYYLLKNKTDSIEAAIGSTDGKSTSVTSSSIDLKITDAAQAIYLMAVIEVSTLSDDVMYLYSNNTTGTDSPASPVTGVAYYAPNKPVVGDTTLLKDITVDSANVKYVFEAIQATA